MGDLKKIYAVIEPDGGGENFKEKLASTPDIRDRLHLVGLQGKDVSSLYLADKEDFKTRFAAALKEAQSLAEVERAIAEATSRAAWSECEELAREPGILGRFARDFSALGVAGESRLGKLVYLAVTSRLLDERPVSLAVKGHRVAERAIP